MFRYLLFDADETLFDFARAERFALGRTFDDLGLPFGGDVYDEYHRYNDLLWHMLERGEVTLAELKVRRFQHLIDMFGLTGALPEEMTSHYITNLADGGFLLPGAERVLADAAGSYDCSLITNGLGAVQRGRLAKTGIGKYLSHIFISEEMGVAKPSAAYFEAVLETLGAERNECLVIGDSLSSDMLGAWNAGISKCYLNRKGGEPRADFPIEYRIDSLEGLYDIPELDIRRGA